jgi:hypothetical protein
MLGMTTEENAVIEWDEDQLREAGIDEKRLKRLVRRLESCGQDMSAMGLQLYGHGSGSGTLIHDSRPTHSGENGETADRGSIVASIRHGSWSGGDW